jgi:hypothetical protein
VPQTAERFCTGVLVGVIEPGQERVADLCVVAVDLRAQGERGPVATRVFEVAEGGGHGPQDMRVRLLADACDEQPGRRTGEWAPLDRHVLGPSELSQYLGAERASLGIGAVEQLSCGAERLLVVSRMESIHMRPPLVAVGRLGERVLDDVLRRPHRSGGCHAADICGPFGASRQWAILGSNQ